MSIYNNPVEYAKYCKISLKLASIRCRYFLTLKELADKVICPNCGSNKLCLDDEGGDYTIKEFISCTDCWESYSIEDERFKNWVNYEQNFDEILWFAKDRNESGKKKIEKHLGQDWNIFAKKSTDKLNFNF